MPKNETLIGGGKHIAEVIAATREYMQSRGSQDAMAVPWDVAKWMGLIEPDHSAERDGVYTLSQTFEGQVQRALRALAKQGELIWVKRGAKTSWGNYMSEPRFWTPEQYGRDDQAAREQAQRDVVLRNRRMFIRNALLERGLHPREAERNSWIQNDLVYLSEEEWETLLGLG